MWLMDAYRKKDKVVLWIKTPDDDLRLEHPYTTTFFAEPSAEAFLEKKGIRFDRIRRKDYLNNRIEVLRIRVSELSSFERIVRVVEQGTRYRVALYDADIKPEQRFLYEKGLRPCARIALRNDRLFPVEDDTSIPLKSLEIELRAREGAIERIIIDGKSITGAEEQILKSFAGIFRQHDPDVICMGDAYSKLPFLQSRLSSYRISCPLNRWDDHKIRYKGGRSYWSYGQVRYQDYAVRLRGRFLVDKNSFVGTECDPEGIAEMAYLSGTLYQQTASRSFGAVFQTALIRLMIRRGYLVPYKEKPTDKPLSMLEMVKCDRGGHYDDPVVGFHKDVAEIDFTSMYPWLIYNHNISADTILSDKGPFERIPDVPVRISLAHKGLIPSALKPFIDRRMHYKKNPTELNKRRAKGLKWVLVSCYGYLKFREFKLGIPTSHMAICALSRETLVDMIRLAQDKGFEVVNAIVDSLYIKRRDNKKITEKEVKDFCREIELYTGIPISFEGIFKWMVFLPSVIDKERPLPSTYYGIFSDGRIKARGIELRMRSSPPIVKLFQENVINMMAELSSYEDIRNSFALSCRMLRGILKKMHMFDKRFFIISLRISKTDYKVNVAQKIILEKLKRNGISLEPGQFIRFIHSADGPCLPEEFQGNTCIEEYKKLLVRSLFVIIQPFGFSREDILERLKEERQAGLDEYIKEKVVSLETAPYQKSARV